jgi:hypothetical protein
MQLDKWTLIQNRLLNFGANVMDFIKSKKCAFYGVLFLIAFSFTLGYRIKYDVIKTELTWKHFLEVSTKDAQRQAIENKVKAVMKQFGCKDFEIYDAIMKTKWPVLISCMIGQESGYNSLAVSPVGAKGICQIMNYHWKPGQDWRDPITSIKIADKLISEYMEYFKKDPNRIELTLASYNAGFPLVSKFNQIPDIQETKQYVKNILMNYKR